MAKRKIDWTNTLFLVFAHLAALAGVLWLVLNWHWQTAVLGVAWFACCGFAITGGYHRLFAHPTYEANGLLRCFFLLFGAASVQNSALKWSYDHRKHHAKVDTDEDPYNITRGFWWAHVGWVLFEDKSPVDESKVKDLAANPAVLFQHRFYIPLAILVGALVPGLIALGWGDAIGAILVVGFLRLVVQWHATFSVNSFAHWVGSQPYSTKNTARDSWITAIITLGEGYHNFHHRFQSDYRNGVRWYHLDPTKWLVWGFSKLGITRGLRRTSRQTIEQARRAVLRQAA